uniref:Ig-like domain-containing protein n=1 Tax=Panagrolaimus sp. ES5 TaxID=591445 RepID=A0AC34FG20_9BILA
MVLWGRRTMLVVIVVICIISFIDICEARGGRKGGKGKGKSNLQFAQVAEFSLIQSQLADNRFRLGYKLVMICKARGEPRPMIKWFKEGAEMQPKSNTH